MTETTGTSRREGQSHEDYLKTLQARARGRVMFEVDDDDD